MKVLYAASEANPFMASGGLGDVADRAQKKADRLPRCYAAL